MSEQTRRQTAPMEAAADAHIGVAQEATSVPERRYVRGRYRVVVETIEATGEARARVLSAITSPSGDELEAVYGYSEASVPEVLRFFGALPGEVVEVEVEWSLPRPGRRRARHMPEPAVYVRTVAEPSADRAVPECEVFGTCGGCQLQHMSYTAQLRWKTERVRAELAAAGVDASCIKTAIGCETPWGYRNHMRFSVNRDGQPGLTAHHSRRVLPLRLCPIAHPRINDALAIISEQPLPSRPLRAPGSLAAPRPSPQAVLRYAEATGEMLLQPPASEATAARLRDAGIETRADVMEERLAGATFRIRPSSFFQTNTRQAERMAQLVLDRMPCGADTTLVDAYCGVGTFAALLAPRAGRVIAIEESASAIRDARWNLRDAPNVAIVQAKVEEVLPGMAERLDGLVIDPPRAGCQRPVLDALAARRVPHVVYVSCNPATLARDLAYLCRDKQSYRIVEAQPLDMFPQTAHIETIVTLEAQ